MKNKLFKFCKKYDDLASLMKDWKEQIPGGLAKGKDPKKFNKKQLEKGVKVEMEHTKDPHMALEIAMDHLVENPDHYYDALEDMEEKMDKKAGLGIDEISLIISGLSNVSDEIKEHFKRIREENPDLSLEGIIQNIRTDFEDSLEKLETALVGNDSKMEIDK